MQKANDLFSTRKKDKTSNHKKGRGAQGLDHIYSEFLSAIPRGTHTVVWEYMYNYKHIFKMESKSRIFSENYICIYVHQKYVLIVDIVFYDRWFFFWESFEFFISKFVMHLFISYLHLQLRTFAWAIFSD